MGLYQFCQMPFGLTGAPSSFQRLMDSIFHGLPFVTTYIDDVLIHSSSDNQHKEHLKTVFQRLSNAGLTLRGTKCQIGMSGVHYSTERTGPDRTKFTHYFTERNGQHTLIKQSSCCNTLIEQSSYIA